MPEFPADAHLKGGQNAAPVLAQLAREFYAPIIPVVLELHGQGLSLRAIATELEQRGIKSRWGWPRWSAAQVRRVLARGLAAAAESPP
jgi:Recombinase